MSEQAITVTGLDEVKRAIVKLPPKLAERVTRLALRQGASYMLRAIKSSAPVRTGRLKRSLRIRNSSRNKLERNGVSGLYITYKKGKRGSTEGAYYLPFVEHGYNKGSKKIGKFEALARGVTTLEEIKRRKLASAKYRGKKKHGMTFRYGGKPIDGQHFMRQTFDATASTAANLIVQSSEHIGRQLTKELGF